MEHGEIPGYMSAMTMPFTVRDSWALTVLKPGQAIRATLVVDRERSWLEGISITESSDNSGSGNPAAGLEPAIGSEVPDFHLINQNGAPISIRQYRGRTLLLTFIYTRCPLPDYCPRMSRNFAEIHAAILKDPVLKERCRLLSISFDPEFDTPEVLQKYGSSYTLRAAQKPFDRWEFATGAPDQVRKAAAFFGLEFTPDGNRISHTLRTALVGPDGRLLRVYRGNDWSPVEVVDQVRRSLAAE